MMHEKFEACILCGAIGDAWGSVYENQVSKNDSITYYLAKKTVPPINWMITDDTQLTLATCEALSEPNFYPEHLAEKILHYYKDKKLTGLGASTLKAILDIEAGINWRLAGRRGEFAAGNGAAMRIAPFAFFEKITRENIFDACRITHNNDEAFCGALAVYLSIKNILNHSWQKDKNLIEMILPELPDTKVKDRLIEINSFGKSASIAEIGKLGTNGYVVNSVPFAIFCSTKVFELSIEKTFQSIMDAGGDTDTNASIAGQIMGSMIGINNIPPALINKLKTLPEYVWIKNTIDETKDWLAHKRSD